METPSQRLIASAQAAPDAVDIDGRCISLRRITALDKLRLFKAAGPVLAHNQPWLGLAILAASVTAIDGVPVPLPTAEAHIEAMVARLGDHGLAAIAAALKPSEPESSDLGSHAKN